MSATDVLGPSLIKILECVEGYLTTPVALATLSPGATVAFDNCCEGELWVRVIGMSGASSMPKPATQPCAPLYQVRIGVGVVRCAHVMDDNGKPPTAAEMTADTLDETQDMADIMAGLSCCAAQIPGVDALRIDQWAPLGVMGDCHGGEWQASFRLNACPGC